MLFDESGEEQSKRPMRPRGITNSSYPKERACLSKFNTSDLGPTMVSRTTCNIFQVLTVLMLVSTTRAGARQVSSTVIADSKGVYHIDANNRRHLLIHARSNEVFADSTMSVSPDQKWVLIDYLPAHPGHGRVEEVRILVSTKTGSRIEGEAFNKKFNVWLDELSEWSRNEPATIVLADGKHIHLD